MVALVVAGLLTLAHRQAAWDQAATSLRSMAKTYEKWGITFKPTAQSELEAAGAPLPGKLEVSGSYVSSDELEIHVATTIGEKHAVAVDLGGTYKIGADGWAKEGQGAVFVEGVGLAGSFKGTADSGYDFVTSFEDVLGKVGFHFGRVEETPLSFELNLGVVKVEVDPRKYARHLKQVGPELLKVGEDKIGGVSLKVDADAMAFAVANASEPPADFLQGRVVVSVKSLASGRQTDLGDLTSLTGAVVDDENQDVYLIGTHEPARPPIPAERLATVERAVCEAGMHPYISIDPQGADFTKPHRARIGGVPHELEATSLIGTMLLADYSMKQLSLGKLRVEGLPDMNEIQSTFGAFIAPTRFWINPSPLRPGDVERASSPTARLYSVRTSPLVMTQPLQVDVSAAGEPQRSGGAEESAPLQAASEEARLLTRHFDEIAEKLPDSYFAEADQDLQMTNLISLLAKTERQDWTTNLLKSLGSLPIPAAQIPTEFPALSSDDVTIGGLTSHLEGGMTTDVAIPTPTTSTDDLLVTHTDLSQVKDLPPASPVALEPQFVSPGETADRLLLDANQAFENGDFAGARDEAKGASALRGGWDDADFVLLMSLTKLGASDGTSAVEFSETLNHSLAAHPDSWKILLLDAGYSYGLGLVSVDTDSKHEYWRAAVETLGSVVSRQPDAVGALSLRAKIEHRLGQEEASSRDWDAATVLAPLDSDNYFGRAGLEAKGGDLDVAKADLDRTLTLNPRDSSALLMRAEIKRRESDLEGSISDAKEAFLSSQTDWVPADFLAKELYEAGRFEACVQVFDTALRLVPMTGLGSAVNLISGKRMYPVPYRPVNRWEDFVERSGDERDPSSDLGLFAEATPFDPEMLYLKGQAEYKLESWQAASEDFEAAKPYFPDRATELDGAISRCRANLGG